MFVVLVRGGDSLRRPSQTNYISLQLFVGVRNLAPRGVFILNISASARHIEL